MTDFCEADRGAANAVLAGMEKLTAENVIAAAKRAHTRLAST